jgi:hypothetical protein
MQFSRANPHSVNYDPESIEVEMVDNEGNKLDDGVIKTVVLYVFNFLLMDLTVYLYILAPSGQQC